LKNHLLERLYYMPTKKHITYPKIISKLEIRIFNDGRPIQFSFEGKWDGTLIDTLLRSLKTAYRSYKNKEGIKLLKQKINQEKK